MADKESVILTHIESCGKPPPLASEQDWEHLEEKALVYV